MLPGFMIARVNCRFPWLLVAFSSLFVVACEKVPLQAPTGSTIIITASTNVLPVDATTEIIAQVLEAAGTPPHSGTLVTFTTTLGTMLPAQAETDVGGRVVVRFVSGAASGSAVITATSGGATTGTNGAVKIAVGTAAVGRVSVNATPAMVSANGGSTTVVATVFDINGNTLRSAPVSFTTTAGTLSSSLVSTDANDTYKPDPRAYQLGVDHLQLAKQDIVFAAFGGWDAAGAKSFGYPTVWVNRFNQPPEELGVRPDRTVTGMDGLLDFVLNTPPSQPHVPDAR